VNRIDGAHKEIGDAQKQKIVIVEKTTGVPHNDEDAKGDDNTKQLSQAVKEKKTVEAGKIYSSKD
jgi:hypothetical protein